MDSVEESCSEHDVQTPHAVSHAETDVNDPSENDVLKNRVSLDYQNSPTESNSTGPGPSHSSLAPCGSTTLDDPLDHHGGEQVC